MSDTVEQARVAREKLALALSILQSPEAGSLIDTVAEPVARAMSALHQLETSRGEGAGERTQRARDAVREALAALQSSPEGLLADQALEHIAGSLGILHGLAEQAKLPAPAPRAAPADQAAPAPPPPAATRLGRTLLTSEPIAEPQINPAPEPVPAAPGGVLDATLPRPASSPFAEGHPRVRKELASTQASAQHSVDESPPLQAGPPLEQHRSAPRAAAQPSPYAKTEAQPSVEPRKPTLDSKRPPLPPQDIPADALHVEANLGAHSPTNFYKGLSGNDVVNDGGLFVATYDIPPMDALLCIQVNMPGGYDFQALAQVRWTRESEAGDAPPGFGCAFTSISAEARRLVDRYVSNREPLFHDDL